MQIERKRAQLLLGAALAALAALPARAELIPQEELTGKVLRVLPGAIELGTAQGKVTLKVSAGNEASLGSPRPGDTLKVWFEREARAAQVLRRGPAPKQEPGRAPVIDDRAHYDARFGKNPAPAPRG